MDRLAERVTLLLPLILVSCALSGCCELQTVADSFSHWGETRADCSLPETCTPGCGPECVSLQPPVGYLNDGATFAGVQITGPPSKSAVDRMVELDDEVEHLRDENERLQQQLEIAERTILEQGRAIDTAGKELQRAMQDYGQVRDRLDQWYDELNSLNGQVRRSFQQQQGLLDRFEGELETVLANCDNPIVDEVERPEDGQPDESLPLLEIDPNDIDDVDFTRIELQNPQPIEIPRLADSNIIPLRNSANRGGDVKQPSDAKEADDIGVSLTPPQNMKRPTIMFVK